MTPGILERVGQLLIDGINKLKSSIKLKQRSSWHISTAEVMIETATELSQKFTTE